MKTFPESELIINADGSCFHLHLKPEQLADKVVLVGDPARVNTVAAHFDSIECEVSSREFHTITGTYKGKRITAQSHGIGCDNIDIVMNELDNLRRTAAIYSHGMFRGIGEEHRIRRTAEFLCRTQRGM